MSPSASPPERFQDSLPLAIYALPRSHGRYGAERMALATLHGLASWFRPLLIAAPGSVHQEAARLGIGSARVAGRRAFTRHMAGLLIRNRRLALISSGVEYSLIANALNFGFRRRMAHLHVAHGGPEPLAYRRKKLLNRLDLRILTVSDYARERLLSYGTRPDKIIVVNNFLDEERAHLLHAVRDGYRTNIQRVVTVSQVEPIKRVDLIFEAIDREPALRALEFRVVGDGPLLEEMRARAIDYPNVELPGFTSDVESELGAADMMLHCCPVEAAPIAVLEGLAAGLPVLAPDAGGAAPMVQHERSGWHFAANDAGDLARQLLAIVALPADEVQRIALTGQRRTQEEYGQAGRCMDYRDLIMDVLER